MKKDLQVESSKVKRRYHRYDHTSPMHLYRMDHQDQYYHAEMKDYSKGGLSLMTSEKLVVGQLVYLEMKNHDESAKGPEKIKSYSGSVKWVNPYPSPYGDAEDSYKYGIEYYEPASYQC